MSPAGYTEDTLVQQTTVDYLRHHLDRRSVSAWNSADFDLDNDMDSGTTKEDI